MKTKSIKPELFTFCCLLTLLLLFSVPVSMAVETTFELQRKIKSDFSKMEKVNKEQEAKTRSLNKEIKEIVTKLMNTSDEKEKEGLRKEYFKKRAEQLRSEAIRVIEIEAALSRIIKNMTLLEKEMRRSIPGDHVKGLSYSDTEYIKHTLRGMANILSPLQKLKANDPKINNMILTLMNLDMGYKAYFRPGGNVSLNQQIEFLQDLHAHVYSTKLLLRQETNYLKSNVYYMMKDGIVRVINDFQRHFYSPDFKGFEDEHEMDKKVLGERVISEDDAYSTTPDLNNIGNW